MTTVLIFLAILAIATLYLAATKRLPLGYKTRAYRRQLSAARTSGRSFLLDVMGTLSIERLTDQKSETVPRQEYFPLAANQLILKGQMVGKDASGNIVPANAATCTAVLGAAAHTVDNTTPPTGSATNSFGLTGLAGVGSLKVEYGVNCWLNDAATGALSTKNICGPCWVKDDQTVSALEGVGLPAGIVCGVGDQKGGGDGQVQVLQGPYGVSLAIALALAQGSSSSEPFKARNVVTSLAAYTGSGTATLTASANGAWATQDGVTNAVGDVVFIQAGTTNLTAALDSGPWQISSLGGAAAKYVLVRPSWWVNGAVMPLAVVIDLGGEGTLWAGTAWKSFAAIGSAVIGTNDPAFYVGRVTQQVTLVAGSATIANVGIKTAAKVAFSTELVTANTATGTVGYGPITAPTPGYIGTATAAVRAYIANMTANASDISTINVCVTNW